MTKARISYPMTWGTMAAKGPLCLPIDDLDFTSVAEISGDLEKELTNGTIDQIQSVYIDNSANANSFTLTFLGSGQRIVVPAGAQNMYPVLAPAPLRYKAATTIAAVIVPISFTNVPLPLAQWGPMTVNVAAVNASMVPVQKNVTTTNFVLTGAADNVLAANAARTRLVLQAAPNNAGPIAINYGAAPALGTTLMLGPGEKWDSSVGPVSAQQVRAIGTVGDILIMQES